MSADDTDVQRFYRGSALFVTGASGFLGKLVVEKVLRSCTGVRRVYVLMRPKRGLTVDQRKKEMLDNVVFDRMKSEQPDSVEKIVFVSGDCSEPRLGLSDSDYHDLTQHVNVVMHLAATVRFDEKLKVALTVNVKGVQEVIRLCRDIVSLKAAVFVSTAFSNCHRIVVKEQFYEPPTSVEDVFAMMDKFTGSELEVLSKKIIAASPNTYVYSKAIFESVIETQGKGLPIVMVRPSMVLSTITEPVAGWLHNMYGPIAIAIGVGCGIMRVSYQNERTVLDMVPADTVTNCILASAATINTRSQDAIPIYNVTTSDNNPVTIREYSWTLFKMVREYPMKTSIWYPYIYLVDNYYIYWFLEFFLHFLPGVLLDFVLRLVGKPQIMLKIYRKTQKHTMLTNYFSTHALMFLSDNTRALYEALSSRDKKLFPFDTQVIHWYPYFTKCGKEARKHLLNETFDSIDEARSRNKIFYLAHILLKTIFWGVVVYAACKYLQFEMCNCDIMDREISM